MKILIKMILVVGLVTLAISGCLPRNGTSENNTVVIENGILPTNKATSTRIPPETKNPENAISPTVKPIQTEIFANTVTPSTTLTNTPQPTDKLTEAPVYEKLQIISDKNAHLLETLLELKSSSHRPLSEIKFASSRNLLIASHGCDIFQLWEFPQIGIGISVQNYQENSYAPGGDLLAISPDGKIIASGDHCGSSVWVQDIEHGKILFLPKTELLVDDLIFSSDSKNLIIAGQDSKTRNTMIEFWNLVDQKRTVILDDLPQRYGSICSLAINSDGTTLAAGFCNYQMVVWNLSEGNQYLGKVQGLYSFSCNSHYCPFPTNKIVFKPNSNVPSSNGFCGYHFAPAIDVEISIL